MEEKDLSEVLEIERDLFPIPFKKEFFQTFLSHDSYYSWIVKLDNEIIGYVIYSFVIDEIDVVNIAVARHCQSQGIGQFMMEYLLEHARVLNVASIFLEVRESNEHAKNFYKKNNFKQIHIRKKYYNNEDALIYRLETTDRRLKTED